MPLDAICLSALTRELAPKLTGAKIDKVQMPERDMLLLGLRSAGENLRLLLSAGGSARIHLTQATFDNPPTPPMFCMLMRKHLTGARITALTQPFMERLIILELAAPDEMGDIAKKSLVLELIGRACNIILVGTDGRIIDCLRHVDAERNERRQLLPGLVYHLPPKQEKPCFFSLSSDERCKMWEKAPPDSAADRWLLDTFSGLSPLVCRELAYRAYNDENPRKIRIYSELTHSLCREMDALFKLVEKGNFTPCMLLEKGQPRDFCFMPVMQYGESLTSEIYPDFSSLLDAFYTQRDRAEGLRQRARELTRTVKTARDRLLRKLDALERELLSTKDREQLRWRGDMITANLYRLKKGMSSFTAQDFYAEGSPEVTVPLDPLKTPQQNAAACYKAYAKAKTAEQVLTGQLANARGEAEYLESVLEELARADSERDLEEIRRELAGAGYIRERQERKRRKPPQAKPLRFVSDSGFTIFVGRSNLQNDELTMKTARRSDLWLHTQKIHGSHVVVVCEDREPDELTIMQAASLAAYYSAGRDAGRVAVDYTQVRHVKKPAGSRPGMVVYTDYKTVFAVPDEALAKRLSAPQN